MGEREEGSVDKQLGSPESHYCLSCGKIEDEFDSICNECKENENYPDTIYGV